jgi:predicted MFS family arabinose efflux permease
VGKKTVKIILFTRAIRMFAYGFLAVVLALYLAEIGFTTAQIGLIITMTLVGDAIVSLMITTQTDRIGRKRILIVSAVLMTITGVIFLLTQNFLLLLVVSTLGIISLSNGEFGPFMAVEQSALSQLVSGQKRTELFAQYQLLGSFATALGALSSGWLSHWLQSLQMTPEDSYRVAFFIYVSFGIVLVILYAALTPTIEAVDHNSKTMPTSKLNRLGLHRSSKTVLQLSVLFGLDSFGSGLITQSFIILYLTQRFDADAAALGSLLFGVNIFSGLSSLASARLAKRIGLINTMVYTHIPANVMVMLLPLMSNYALAMVLLLVRAMLQQMDVAPRQAYVMAVVSPDERSSAAGITNLGKTVGAALAPALAGGFISASGLTGIPFVAAGAIKIVYDLALFQGFRMRRVEG